MYVFPANYVKRVEQAAVVCFRLINDLMLALAFEILETGLDSKFWVEFVKSKRRMNLQ